MRWLLTGERLPGRARAVGEGVFRPDMVGEAGLAVGEGVRRLLTKAVASAVGVTGLANDSNGRGVAIVWSPCGQAARGTRQSEGPWLCLCGVRGVTRQ